MNNPKGPGANALEAAISQWRREVADVMKAGHPGKAAFERVVATVRKHMEGTSNAGEYRIPQELVDRVKANKQKESNNE